MQEQNEKTQIEEILGVVNFIKDHAASQESVDNLAEQVQKLKDNASEIRSSMVTKDYLDNKLADVRSDFGSLVRKEDAKLRATVVAINQANVFSKEKTNEILTMEPYPQLSL
jgi:ElaB/YqjD/DUF883 family membrane-anchored ribosome-binding protein